MPCYNISKSNNYISYLAKQSFKNFELICINDCSNDDTLSILKSYKKDLECLFDFKIIDLHSNVGPGKARNLGIAECEGEFIIFLDSDDYLSELTLKTINDVLLSDVSIDCVVFDYSICKNDKKYEQSTFKKSGFISLYEAFVFTSNGISGKCVRKSLVAQNDIKFLNLKRCEDYPFFRHIYLVSNKIYYLKEPFYNYVMNDNSLMHNSELINVDNAIAAFDYLTTKTDNNKLLGIAFAKNCLYSNVLSMMAKKNSHQDFKNRIIFLKTSYKNYCRVSNLKPYSLKVKIVSIFALLDWYWLLKWLYKRYEKRSIK